ncbi:TIM-barrel domain-containing protein [Lacticaseibacillus daqingensis]|uniref:TIM-barrel domain-containing protein n=1 Tax=Lacticaseibacillus daqingensis TaxID=2486014 RepID=UPI000F779EE8|nr:TIM-barrel domain-containing protein [Lacticaseibacillus daqingensis]
MAPDPNQLSHLHEHAGTIYFDYHDWHARLQAVNDHLVRLTVTAQPDWPATPSVPAAPTVEKHADETIATGGAGQHFEAPLVTATATQPLTLQDGTLQLGAHTLQLAAGRLTITQNGAPVATLRLPQLTATGWTARLVSDPQAAYFGGGVQNGHVALNGLLVAIKNENRWTRGSVSSPAPFYWSTSGYGFLAHTFTPGEYDFGDPHAGVYLRHDDPVFDAYLILGSTPQALIHGYHELTGLPNLNPRFAFYPAHFNAYNRDYWVAVTPDSAGASQFADGQWYKAYQPIRKETFNTGFRPGAITVAGMTLVPNVYGDGRVTFTDPTAAGQPRTAIRETLNGEHDPQFSARAVVTRYAENGVPLGWFLPNDGYGAGYGQTDSLAGDLENLQTFADWAKARGVTTGLWTQAALAPKDPAAPQKGERDFAREVTAGVRAIKTDVAWVGEGYTFGLNATTKAAAEFTRRDLRPMIVTLDGWAGTQRTATVWTGDQAGGDWGNLRTHIASYLAAGLSGQANIASDVDGIYAGNDPVIQTRDLQWKAFTPHFFAMDGWGSAPRLMGMQLPVPFAAIDRAFLRYHTMLIPLLYSLAHTARTTGAPIMRPTFWANADAYTTSPALEDQFLLGDTLLVAPLTSAYGLTETGAGKRDHVYLPAGEWVDAWTNTRYTGRQTLTDVATPLAQLPLFLRAGAILPLTPAHQNPAAATQTRWFEWVPGGHASLTLVQDDGETLAYQRGEQALTQLTTQPRTLTLAATTGHFAGQTETVPMQLFIVGASEPVTVTVDGQPATPSVTVGPRLADPLHRQAPGLRIDLGPQSIRATIAVTLG